MIRWCGYCQAFLGERAPYDDPSFTHGICESCAARLTRGEPLVERTAAVRALFGRVLASARAADAASCAALVAEARSAGLGAESFVVGLLQPALHRAGLEWTDGHLPAPAAQALTAWCECAFALLAGEPGAAPLDLLIVQAPGNAHTIGARFAAAVLAARGLAVRAVVEPLAADAIVALAGELEPAAIGVSCALPDHVARAAELVAALRPRVDRPLFLSGHALRAGDVATPPDVAVAVELDEVERLVRGAAARG